MLKIDNVFKITNTKHINAMNLESFLKRLTDSKTKSYLLIALIVWIAYFSILGSSFRTMDDRALILLNEDIRSWDKLLNIFFSPYFKTNDYYRPLVLTSYMIEYHFFGLKAFLYYFINIFLHISNSFLVYLLSFYFLKNRVQALFVGLLFGIHPVQWEAVSNISGQAILLSAFFGLNGFILFLKYLNLRKLWLLCVSTMCYLLALLSKESGGCLFFVLFLYIFFFPEDLAFKKSKSINLLTPFLLVALLYLGLRSWIGVGRISPWNSLPESFLAFSTFLFGVLTYLRNFILLDNFYFDRSMLLFRSVFSLEVACVWSFYLSVCFIFWYFRKQIPRLIIFCLCWFFVELLPVSQLLTSIIIQPGRISLADHFIYTAVVPFMLLFVYSLGKFMEWIVSKSVISWVSLRIIIGACFIFLIIMSFRQAVFSSNEFIMIKDSLKREPENARLQLAMGLFYLRVAKYEPAKEHLQKAVDFDPSCARCQIALGLAYYKNLQFSESMKTFNQVLPNNEYESQILEKYKQQVMKSLTQ